MSRRVALVGGFVLFAIAFITYFPGLKMGFYLDDYVYLDRAGRMDWSNAIAQIFDPRLQIVWYRPLQAIQWFLEFQIFGGNANAYHLVNMTFYAIDVLLMYVLVWRISRQWRLGLTSALFFATFPVYASGVNWIGIVDPLTAIFYLLCIWFWWMYLEQGRLSSYAFALVAFVLALMSKQVSATLPIILLLFEWWVLKRPFSLAHLVKRYGPFAAIAGLFVLVQYLTQSTHTFIGVFGWQLGTTMAFILVQYLVLFFFPWGIFPSIDLNLPEVGGPVSYAWASVAVFLLVYVTWRSRSRVLLFLSVFALLNLIPVLPFPFIEHRYLFIPIMSGAVLLALLYGRVRDYWDRLSWFRVAGSAILALLAVAGGLAVNTSALEASEWARQLRVPFRDIERTHASFPDNSLLYFIDPITPTEGGLAGMFLQRYGRGVIVKNWTQAVGLREYNAAYVYYFDETRRPREIAVETNVSLVTTAKLPLEYSAPIRLEGYELARATLSRGMPLVLLLNWRGMAAMDTNYTVFVHLLNAKGELVAGFDSPPRKGQFPTSTWKPNVSVRDAIVMPVGSDLPAASGYRVELGLYDPRTHERLAIVDARGAPIADVVTFGPVSIAE